ncbi:MAG: carboxypeptidase regulatory-like domain-containing protein [Bacteroidales bacterium]|nr:carboxypeptidase regulatory-like domain-containing protein [Bacteroidales bacterium]
MLKANEVFPNFHLKYGALIQKSDDLTSSATRDLVDLALYGMTQGKLDETKTLRNEFADMPTDAELIGDKIGKTEAKAEKSKELRVLINDIVNRVGLKYGKSSWQYRKIRVGDLSRIGDSDLCRSGKATARTMTSLIDENSSIGLTQELLDKLNTVTQEFDDLIDLQIDAVKERDIVTQKRRLKANELYKKLIHISETGKAAYMSTNEAKYNDYIIYNTASGKRIAKGFGILSGNISGKDEILLHGAKVKVEGTELTATSNENGEYLISDIPVGTYTFIASAEGYKNSVINNIEISDGDSKEIDFELIKVED